MSITIGCDIEGCKETITVLDCDEVESDLAESDWSSEWVHEDNKDFHICRAHKEGKP